MPKKPPQPPHVTPNAEPLSAVKAWEQHGLDLLRQVEADIRATRERLTMLEETLRRLQSLAPNPLRSDVERGEPSTEPPASHPTITLLIRQILRESDGLTASQVAERLKRMGREVKNGMLHTYLHRLNTRGYVRSDGEVGHRLYYAIDREEEKMNSLD